MKSLSTTILSIALVSLLSSCGDKYLTTHKPFQLLPICEFEKFTEEEKKFMVESAGRKISRNQKSCFARRDRNQENAEAHNKAHND